MIDDERHSIESLVAERLVVKFKALQAENEKYKAVIRAMREILQNRGHTFFCATYSRASCVCGLKTILAEWKDVAP